MSDWGTVSYNKQRGCWAVVGTWQGKREYFSQYQSMIGPVTCSTREMADRLKVAINTDIEKGIFSPARYKQARPLHLAAYARKWLEDMRMELATGTWHGYESALRRYILPAIGDRFLADIGHEDLKAAVGAMAGLSPKTRRNHLGVLHRLMAHAHRDGHISQLPPWVEFTGRHEVVPPPIKYLTPEAQMRIVEAIPLADRPIYLFMMATGCRPSEARALRKQDVYWDQGHILFVSAFGYRGELKEVKQKRAEPFPITDEIRAVLDMAPKGLAPWVFPDPKTGDHYTRNINDIWNRACDTAGVRRIRLYPAVRHSYACQLLNLGVDKAVVSRLLRHSDPRMVERYAMYETATLEKPAGLVARISKQPTNEGNSGRGSP